MIRRADTDMTWERLAELHPDILKATDYQFSPDVKVTATSVVGGMKCSPIILV